MKFLNCANIATDQTILGDRALAALPLFRQHGLTLHCNVPPEALSPQPKNASGTIDCLICQGDQPLLAAAFNSSCQAPPPGIPFLRLVYSSVSERAGLIQQSLEKIFRQSRDHPRSGLFCRLHPVQMNQLKSLSRVRIAEKVPGGWQPTEYGKSLGLVRSCPSSRDGPVYCALSCTPEAWAAVERLRAQPADQTEDLIPLQRRLAQLNQGLPAAPASSRAVAGRFAKAPLAQYLQDFPKALSQFRNYLSPMPATYQQAAARINSLLLNKDTRARGRELMCLLALPMVEHVKAKKQKGR